MYWYAGQPEASDAIALPVDHPALLYGATVFTTMRVYNHSLAHPWTDWSHHGDRLRRQIQLLHWSEPNWHQVEQGIAWIAPHKPVVRVTLMPDGTELITGRDIPPSVQGWQQTGIRVWIASGSCYQRWLPEAKTGNYLGSWLALQHARQQEAQEAILLNEQGDWLETSTGNLWGWGNGAWWTPPLTAGILPGVARSHLMQYLTEQGYCIREVPWSAEVMNQLEAIAHSNNVVQVLPIRQVVGHTVDRTYPIPHPAMKPLADYSRRRLLHP